MVRAKLAGKAKKALKEGVKGAEAAAPSGSASHVPRKLQRKITRKVNFLEKVAASAGGLAGKAGVTKRKKKRQPSAALNSLPLLGESLAESVAQRHLAGGSSGVHRPLGQSVGTLRARERVAEKEMPRLAAVLEHPKFQANPIAAIASHLSATLPPPPPPAPPALKPAELQQRKRDKKRRQRQRASAAKAANAGLMQDDD